MNIVYNWHVTEKCNYSCKYCFAHWTHQKEIWRDKNIIHQMLLEMKEAENSLTHLPFEQKSHKLATRINFAGGEPLLLGNSLIDFAQKAQEIGLKTSMISNGSLLLKFKEISRYMNMIGISVDSLCSDTNYQIGRHSKNGSTLTQDKLSNIVIALRKENPDVDIKFNIVVNQYNYQETLVQKLLKLSPEKIKIFRQLPFGKNQFGISDEMFDYFLTQNYQSHENIYVEGNEGMTHSYLMIDPFGRFFQNGNNYDYSYSEPIHKVGFSKALNSIAFDAEEYFNRYKTGVK